MYFEIFVKGVPKKIVFFRCFSYKILLKTLQVVADGTYASIKTLKMLLFNHKKIEKNVCQIVSIRQVSDLGLLSRQHRSASYRAKTVILGNLD